MNSKQHSRHAAMMCERTTCDARPRADDSSTPAPSRRASVKHPGVGQNAGHPPPPRTFAVATNPAKRAFKLALRRLLETHYRQLGDSDVISIPAGFRRHLVGKTLINVSHCDIAEIRFVWQASDHTDIFINQRIECYLNNTINPRPLTPRILPCYPHKMAIVSWP